MTIVAANVCTMRDSDFVFLLAKRMEPNGEALFGRSGYLSYGMESIISSNGWEAILPQYYSIGCKGRLYCKGIFDGL